MPQDNNETDLGQIVCRFKNSSTTIICMALFIIFELQTALKLKSVIPSDEFKAYYLTF